MAIQCSDPTWPVACRTFTDPRVAYLAVYVSHIIDSRVTPSMAHILAPYLSILS